MDDSPRGEATVRSDREHAVGGTAPASLKQQAFAHRSRACELQHAVARQCRDLGLRRGLALQLQRADEADVRPARTCSATAASVMASLEDNADVSRVVIASLLPLLPR